MKLGKKKGKALGTKALALKEPLGPPPEAQKASILEKFDAFEKWIRSGKPGIVFADIDGLGLPEADASVNEKISEVPDLPDAWTDDKEQAFREWTARGMPGILIIPKKGPATVPDVEEKLWRHVFNMFLETEGQTPSRSDR